MTVDKVVVLSSRNPKYLSLHFLDFSMILYRIYKFTVSNLEVHVAFALKTLESSF